MRFELGAWDGDAAVPLSRWQHLPPADASAALFLELDGKEWIGDEWSLGELALLAHQLEVATMRVEAGVLAIVRSAEDDGACVPYLRLRPRDDRVELTLFFIATSEGDLGSLYPVAAAGDPARLYAWVEAAGDQLLDRLPDDLRAMTWSIEVMRDVLIEQLRATVQRARELGVDMPSSSHAREHAPIDWARERIELLPRSGIGIVAPWLVIAPPKHPIIRLDLRALDELGRVTDADDTDDADQLLLVCGDLDVALYVADGPHAAARIAAEAAPLVRSRAARGTPMLIVGNDPVTVRGELLQIGELAYRIGEVREYALRGANLPLGGGRLLQAAMALLVVAAAERDP